MQNLKKYINKQNKTERDPQIEQANGCQRGRVEG